MYNYEGFVKQLNIKNFSKSIQKAKVELGANLELYDNKYVIDTIVSGAAGQYKEIEFLEAIGYPKKVSNTDDFIYETVIEEMAKLTNDLETYCKENGINIDGFTINVFYNESDGAIDVWLLKTKKTA